ncbi:MAG: TrkA family potassium uptake protein [Actinomycetota bacterium]|nr:TrkA family potassium uptake protein [Actinomycetota bacterium]
MNIVIAGAGAVGRFVAKDLLELGHQVILIDKDIDLIERHRPNILAKWVHADVCEPAALWGEGLDQCDVMVAATGDDKVNLVASLLAKQEFAIPRVLARVNHPNNEWLFNESWGVDAPVSPPHLLTSLVEEAVVVGDLVTLLRLEHGKVLLVEFTLTETSPAVGKVVGELSLPPDCSLVAVVRGGHVIAPSPETPLMIGDEILALTAPETKEQLESVLAGREESFVGERAEAPEDRDFQDEEKLTG